MKEKDKRYWNPMSVKENSQETMTIRVIIAAVTKSQKLINVIIDLFSQKTQTVCKTKRNKSTPIGPFKIKRIC